MTDTEIGVRQRRGSRHCRPSTPRLRVALFSSRFKLLKAEAGRGLVNWDR